MAPPSSRQFLLLDGDDTLWENNIYFEEAIEAFIDFLAHSSMTRAQVRAALDEIERINIGVRGYGSGGVALAPLGGYGRVGRRGGRPDRIGPAPPPGGGVD